MKSLNLNEILIASGGKLLTQDDHALTTGVSINSRTLKKKNLFISIKGENFDGHKFIGEAFKAGAAGALINKKNSIGQKKLVTLARKHKAFLVQVDSTEQALGSLAAFWRRKFRLPIIAITGSNGKTSCKEMICQILEQKYKVLKSEGNLNNHLGLPLSLLKLTNKHEIAVLEMGMNAPGEISYLAALASPQVGIITNVGRAHLEGLKTVHAVAKAKGELLKKLPKKGVAILNADDPETKYLLSLSTCLAASFGVKKAATYRGENLKPILNKKHFPVGMSFSVKLGKKKDLFQIPIPSEDHVSNALAALAIGDLFLIPIPKIKKALKNFSMISNRMEPITVGSYTILNDVYNANPDSTISSLKTLGSFKRNGFAKKHRLIAILGEMKELGSFEKKGHALVGEMAAKQKLDLLITVGKAARSIATGAKRRGLSSTKIHVFEQKLKALSALPSLLKKGDVILIKGSRSSAMESFTQSLREAKKRRTT